MVELVGHEPPLNDANWQSTEFTLHGHRVVLGFPFYQTREALNRQATFLALLGAGLWLFLSGTTGWVVRATLQPIQSLHTGGSDGRGRPAERSHPITSALSGRRTGPPGGHPQWAAGSNPPAFGPARAISRGRFHELRTPLQALLGHLEVALLRDRTLENREVLQECTHQTQRLGLS